MTKVKKKTDTKWGCVLKNPKKTCNLLATKSYEYLGIVIQKYTEDVVTVKLQRTHREFHQNSNMTRLYFIEVPNDFLEAKNLPGNFTLHNVNCNRTKDFWLMEFAFVTNGVSLGRSHLSSEFILKKKWSPFTFKKIRLVLRSWTVHSSKIHFQNCVMMLKQTLDVYKRIRAISVPMWKWTRIYVDFSDVTTR